jgi:hypothetical protein
VKTDSSFIGFPILFLIAVAFAVTPARPQNRVGIPSYQDPGTSQWDTWAAQGPSAVGIMIVNLNNGDDTTYYPSVDAAIRDARKSGIFVLGYTYTGYGSRDPSIVRSKIDAVYQNYLIDGIFFDEAPTDCGAANSYHSTAFEYYQELTNYVRKKDVGARITVLNPGTQTPQDCWMGITNILMNFEDAGLQTYQQNYLDYAWTHKYPPDRFWHVIYSVGSARDMHAAVALARQRGAGWVYVTDDGADGNPYDDVPSYFDAEAATITGQGVQAPFATFWSDSTDGSGTNFKGCLAFRWRAVNGSRWQIFMDTDQNPYTGYHDSGVTIGADFLLEMPGGSAAHLYRYAGSGTDWKWTPVQANSKLTFPDPGINLAQFDMDALGSSRALNYQIRSLSGSRATLYTSYVIPLSLNNTSLVFDILNHDQ